MDNMFNNYLQSNMQSKSSNGIYFANNAISKNMIMINRNELLNGNSFITGVSGSGKSLLSNQEVINLFLADKNADTIIIDPEKEYGKIYDAFGGETTRSCWREPFSLFSYPTSLPIDTG